MSRYFIGVVFLLFLVACQSSPPSNQTKTFSDTTGDAVAGVGVNWDVVGLETQLSDTALQLTLTFNQAVQLPAADSPSTENDLTGYLVFDVDQDPQTPPSTQQTDTETLLNLTCPNITALGADFYIDLVSASELGKFPVYKFSDSFDEVDIATISVADKKLVVSIPLDALEQKRNIGLGFELGNGQAKSDCMPDGSQKLTS
jgi:hypothetical protein